jgi:hypothetical protein
MCKGGKNIVSCKSLFHELKIITVIPYIFLRSYVYNKNKTYITQYSDIHGYNTIHKYNFVILSIVKEGWLAWEQKYLMVFQLNEKIK